MRSLIDMLDINWEISIIDQFQSKFDVYKKSAPSRKFNNGFNHILILELFMLFYLV